LLALAAVLLAFLLFFLLSGSISAHRVRDRMDGFGVAGPLVFIVISSMLTVVLFPGPVLSGASGLLFGTALGTPISIVSATLGASLAFAVSRWWAHDAVAQHARMAGLRAWVGARGFESVLLARIAPGVPYNLVNYVAGLTPIGLGVFAGATALGVAPRAFAYTALGGSLGHLGSPVAIVALGLLVVEGAVGIWLMRRRTSLRAAGSGRAKSSPGARSAGPR
jgi:uncharacterized membrane protein YdjX (TVP38/TMEM64 family)